VPEVSRFFGIAISMYFEDHQPPHFHARYGGSHGVFEIASLSLLRGSLPGRPRGLVVEWASAHRDELLANWACARAKAPLLPISPLE